MSSKSLPYSKKDVYYDNAKFRHRSFFKVLHFLDLSRFCASSSTYLMLTHTSPTNSVTGGFVKGSKNNSVEHITGGGIRFRNIFRKPPRLPPQLPPGEKGSTGNLGHERRKLNSDPKWIARQQDVKKAFIHAWSGYKKYAMGYDELMPVSKRGVDGLGGLGATVVDALDTAMIMGADEVVS
ncbi:hypothetical protein GBA52_012568 [Prunus armeniaca]|nr:hypothetical protein GBA52_012568 [Prunus armeniaca]